MLFYFQPKKKKHNRGKKNTTGLPWPETNQIYNRAQNMGLHVCVLGCIGDLSWLSRGENITVFSTPVSPNLGKSSTQPEKD